MPRLVGAFLDRSEVAIVGDRAQQPEREHAGCLCGQMDQQLGEVQNLRRRLGVERGREILAAGDQRKARAA